MALLPFATLTGLRAIGRRRDDAWWLMAIGFFMSWIADSVADLLPAASSALPSFVYPVSQSAIIAAVLLPRARSLAVLGILVLSACAILIQRGVTGPDVALRSVAWLTVASIAWTRPELPWRLRACLGVYFGLGWVMWLVHVQWLTVATWYPYQAARLVGLLLFCWAAWKPAPTLRLAVR